MKVKKGQIVHVRHRRKGVFHARALKEFDTAVDEVFYVSPLTTVRSRTGAEWHPGEELSLARALCEIS